MLAWIRIFVVATVLASTASADAMCEPTFRVGTADGATIPTRGALYVFSNVASMVGDYPNRRTVPDPVRVTWIGAAGRVELTKVSSNVTKVSYLGDAGSHLVVGAARYTLADSWRPPIDAPSALRFEHDELPGPCDLSNVVRVTLDQPTAALRIRWTFADVTQEWIRPANGNVIDVGEQGCIGTTVPTDQLAIGGHLQLVAIRLNGSEIAVGGMPSTLSFDDASKAHERAQSEEALHKSRAATPRELPRSDYSSFIITFLLLLAGFGLARWSVAKALARLR